VQGRAKIAQPPALSRQAFRPTVTEPLILNELTVCDESGKRVGEGGYPPDRPARAPPLQPAQAAGVRVAGDDADRDFDQTPAFADPW
jgi:hypothetical protein